MSGDARRLKQVIVIRRDLKMRRGKEIAQGSHASGQCLWAMATTGALDHRKIADWMTSGQAKICLRVDSEEELLALQRDSEKRGLRCHVITDSGKTEFHGVPTKTCLAIGPDYEDVIDPVTGHLKTY